MRGARGIRPCTPELGLLLGGEKKWDPTTENESLYMNPHPLPWRSISDLLSSAAAGAAVAAAALSAHELVLVERSVGAPCARLLGCRSLYWAAAWVSLDAAVGSS